LCRRSEEPRGSVAGGRRGLDSLGFLLTPQKGFRVYKETLIDAYSNNPQTACSLPRPLAAIRQPTQALVPVLARPLAGHPSSGRRPRRRTNSFKKPV
jgi:hypothetical protein